MRLARLYRMSFPAGKLLEAYFLADLSFYECRAGDAHEAGVAALNKEVLHHGVISLSAEARAHEQGYLGNDAGRQYLRPEKPAVGFERIHAFLKPGSTGIVHADTGPAHIFGKLKGTGKLLTVVFAERPGHGGEVLSDSHHRPSVYPAISGYNAFRRYLPFIHAKVSRPVFDE